MNELQEQQYELEEPEKEINEANLLTTIWTKPTKTLRYILNYCPNKYVIILLVLGGIVNSIGRASTRNMGDDMSTGAVLVLAVAIGGSLGWISYFIYAWGISVTGKWLGGKSDPSTFRTIIAWSMIPSICSLLLLIPELMILGDDLFKSIPENQSQLNNTSWLIFGVLEATLGIWTIVILVKGIKLAQQFSVGKSIFNMFLPILVFVIPIALIAILVSAM